MYTEKLLLEVQAARLGWSTVRPSLARGRSGTQHQFSYLASSGGLLYGFDVCDEVSEVEVLRSYIKSYDTGVLVQIVSRVGKTTQVAKQLLREYGMRVLTEADIVPFFDELLLRKEAGLTGKHTLTA
jgi:hypothetical protein